MDNIIIGLYHSTLSRNYVPGFAFYLKELNSLLDLKLEIELAKRLEIIQLLYSLLDTTNQLEAFLVEGISNSLTRLLKYVYSLIIEKIN